MDVKKGSVIKAKEFDVRTMEAICSSTWQEVYRFVYYKVQNREEAEDITQETYVKALSYFQKKNIHVEKYSGYLKTIALNIIRDHWRTKRHHGNYVNFEDVDPGDVQAEDFSDETINKDMIEQALLCLKEEERKIIELRIIKGYSVAETAKMMDKKEVTVRVMQYRALKELSKLLKT